jgi:hypothetical protein
MQADAPNGSPGAEHGALMLKDKVAVIHGAGGRGDASSSRAVFMASDKASGMTGSIVNLTMGSLDD